MSREVEVELARDLEKALVKAVGAGLPGSEALIILAKALGYGIAHGNPCSENVARSLEFTVRVMSTTAADVFVRHGGGMLTEGRA